jgi:hypothetical protein
MHGACAQIFSESPATLAATLIKLRVNSDLISHKKGATIAGLLLGNLH